ncbi:hypothetical protein PPYR_09965 [Photinus pyralis]|uniref:Protein Jumonji n=2 Tax=Photinus pyralis TaxID=7054 RepID=A0A1Y1M806_PHOPY|nr:protein Jumonji [Photinus pyralis]XP_031346435.1 protein Jumonji [Photinus pyralis]KAB0795904.1 hypothetical protein PPYR_09965 [Photinus pyralis]
MKDRDSGNKMVISKKDIKRKRKTNNVSCNLLDDAPKRTKVQAQRKFAQGSNVSSPVITPVKEIEKQERQRVDVIPEPQELLPINRPHTEDFLTFLCFRGTTMLPPNLSFFNAAPVDSHVHVQPLQKEPITVIPPIANIGTRSAAGGSERPFIAFGVRKRADPILVTKHMDKKRRHALALQALRRKYQEQKMAKIRAVTISKLSEKVTSKSVVRTRSISKNESNTIKKTIPQKTKVKIISTKHVKVTTRSSIKNPLRTTFTTPIRSTIQKKMCLRSFRGRFIQRELTIKKSKRKNTTKIIKKVQTRQTREISSEFSSDDDQPLKSFKVNKPNKVVTKKRVVPSKKPSEMSFRVTRAHPVLLKNHEQGFKRKIHMVRSTLNPKLPYVKLTAPKLLATKHKSQLDEKQSVLGKLRNKEKVLNLRARKVCEMKKKSGDDKKKSDVSQNDEKDCLVERKVKKLITTQKITPERITRTAITSVPAKNLQKKMTCVSSDVKKADSLKSAGKVGGTKKTEPEANKVKHEGSCKQSVEPTEKLQKLKEKTEIECIKPSDQFRVILQKDIHAVIGNAKDVCKASGKVKVETVTDVPKLTQPKAQTEILLELEKSKVDETSVAKVEAEPAKKTPVKLDSKAVKPKPETLPPSTSKKVDIEKDSKKADATPTDQKQQMEVADVPAVKDVQSTGKTDGIVKNVPEKNTTIPDTLKGSKNKPEKLEAKPIKKKLANCEEPRISQRPTRKTKEAAAIYMEILGHKLVNEDGMDEDNISIDSFPELPNVRKTEQRENELKAIAKSKNHDLSEVEVQKVEDELKCVELSKVECTDMTKIDDNKLDALISNPTPEVPRVLEVVKRVTRGTVQSKSIPDYSDSEDSLKQKVPYKVKVKKTDTGKSKTKLPMDSYSEESSISKLNVAKKVPEKIANIFSDSDEEPLSKLTKVKSQSEKLSDVQTKKEVDTTLTLSGKPKRECTKRPQNYLPLFSSSEDEEKYYNRFTKLETVKSKKVQSKCVSTTSADLLCKDVDKRFGKGKVNMSTEQIEQWLKDSALAGSSIKKEDLYKFDEKSADYAFDGSDSNCKDEGKKLAKMQAVPAPKDETSPPKSFKADTSQCNQKIAEKKTIFRKEPRTSVPKVNAFSANNESSVYAFEADSEDVVSTPFRRPSRRPSSTGTSRSEDSSKVDESSKSKFRYPPPLKQDSAKAANKQEVSLMLSTDESNSASIAVQLDINTAEVVVNAENAQSDREDGEQLFYIPLQPGKQSSSQVIQGVAVKLGTKGANGPNQRVVMSAKLVTHNPMEVQKLVEKPLVTMTSMYPPASTVQKAKATDGKSYLKAGAPSKSSDYSDDGKYKIPSSPSASSSSSTKVTKRQCVKTRVRPLELCNPIVTNEFPKGDRSPMVVEAPTFYPNEKEFQDPLEYIQKIRVHAEQFGICRIVPPSNFKPECKVADDMRFTAYNQYVHKMLHRWGPNFKEFMAISKYLETQNITLTHPPWIGGMEIDLPRLYQIVQNLGGLKEVIEKKKWPKVSELLKIPKSAQDRVTKLDDIYCKYLLPYDTLAIAEREKLFDEVETEWAKRESKTLLKSQQNINARDDASTCSDNDSNDESDECIVKGRSMALNAFYRIARNTMCMWFKTMDPAAHEVEQEFWKHVTVKQNHICVHSGSIDSGNWGYGFAVSKNSPFARHAWNLKVLTNNSASILRSMGPVMGVTVPTLHVGMVFSACCWYRDPHSLPWIEYLHTGGNKIWYGIPDSMSELFRSALLKLVPNYCRNKSLWLPSDTAMVPPSLLVENKVSLCRVIQEPGQFIVVFPKAFTSSLCTGYVVSESVYFAPINWLQRAQAVFNELQNNCEPSMFSLEKLIISIANDARSSVEVLKLIIPIIEAFCDKEKSSIGKLTQLGLTIKERFPLPETSVKKRKQMQSDNGDYECDVCCTNLFISWVIYSQDGAVYCLNHAIESIESKQIDAESCKLFFTYNESELVGLIEKVKNVIDVKMLKKAACKNV